MGEAHRPGNRQLDVRLLGPVEVLAGGRAVALGGPKPRALVAALALEAGRVVSVDRLVESIWPGEPPDTSAHAVQVYVSQLRKALGNDTIATRPPGYVLELDTEDVDVHRFARLVSDGREALRAGDPAAASSALREALALWRGPALADFTYEPFAQAEIARLEELRVVALEERVEADLGLGRHAELVSELEALIESQSLRERPRGQLMLALYRSGRQADALAAYRAARDTLVEELGIEPGPDLRNLEAAILRQDDALLPPEGPAAPAMQFRRLVTILFVDVVESMALAGALDAEALGRVLSGYFEAVSAALTRHGGTVEKYAGDAVMAVFGIPVSHEDDALRAARAAVDIRAAVDALNDRLVEEHGVGLEIRIGMETGEVVTTPTETRQRLVTGEAVGIASRLEQAAGADEIVVGELSGRLIDHAARLEPLGELAIKGRREPVRAFRLHELEAVSPAFEQRLDASLVGRKRELASLRKALKRAVDGSAPSVAIVVGAPGVGKSRLAAELTRRTKGVTTLWGRCLSYGEGITYWPLREVVQQGGEGDERDAILTALEADTPPPAPEIAWRFRQYCEALARERPLIVVFDDVHWGEPTFLELVEHLADKGEGPILVACLAREELLEDRPAFLDERENVERLVLDVLSAEETASLLDGLGGTVLESDQHNRIVETAEGNPLFLEQLLALALEGGLAERALPETIQSLLAARLDRIGPGERAVLERGAVVGKEFVADDVVSLLDPGAAPTVEAHLRSLAARGFLRPRGDHAFSFRHVLVQDAVYRAAPKRLRAELHERFADRLDQAPVDLPELDEFVGYHLEQAYGLRSDLGESDRQVKRLAEDGGRRLGAAGLRAWKRNDVHATVNLLGRSLALLPVEEPLRRELLCEFGIGLRAFGDTVRAERSLKEAIEQSRAASDRRVELRAELEHAYVRLLTDSAETGDVLLEAAAEAIPIFEALGDHRSLGRAWLLAGFVQGGVRSHYDVWAEAAERALEHYRLSLWPTSTCAGEIAIALYYGPTPVPEAIERCEQLLRDDLVDRFGHANVAAFLAGLEAQRAAFSVSWELLDVAREAFEELGQRSSAAWYLATVAADVAVLAADWAAAEQTLRMLCAELERTRDFFHLPNRAADLAEVLYAQGGFEEADDWTGVAERHAASDDVTAQLLWRSVKAKIVAQRGEFDRAERLARDAVLLADATDGLNFRGRVQRDLGLVLGLAGRVDDASAAFKRAVDLYELKGNLVAAAHVRSLQNLAPV